ncbi:hypothetical protein PQQ96_23660 [Paraburkholderia sediminicola]|uniref:hypothetical protein n=1 Tax=Paraburkholderia sediminicola TaxID=458836 RepID=UPI0038B6CF96
MDAINTENTWSQETMKLLVALNSGSIVALLAMSQALLANGHFHEVKSYLLISLAVFLTGICCGVRGFRARARAWSATIPPSSEIAIKVIHESLGRSQNATAMSFAFFIAGAVVIGIGMALRL